MHSDSQIREVKIHEEPYDFEPKLNFSNKKLIIIEFLICIFTFFLFAYLYFFCKGQINSDYFFKIKLKDHYDYLLVGAGLFNAVLAEHLTRAGKSVLVLEKRSHIGGNCYTKNKFGIDVHFYGPHIFHTSNKTVWEYINQFGEFKKVNFTPMAFYDNELYNLPFNMNILYKLFGIKNPEKVIEKIKKEISKENITKIKNLEEKAISIYGRTIYEKLIKEFTEKKWNKTCKELDPSILKKIHLRFDYNDTKYYKDKYQGIPIDGYTDIIKKMFEDADILYKVDFLKERKKWESMADNIFYSGSIDEYYNYKYGVLEYRNLKFVEKIIDAENYQNTSVISYFDKKYPYTRIIEHKHLNGNKSNKTIIYEEYFADWEKGMVPYYPINNKKNKDLFEKYKNITNKKVQFVGRLGMYKYFDMDDTILEAFKVIEKMDFWNTTESESVGDIPIEID